MPQAQELVLKDHSNTDIHFKPVSINNGVVEFAASGGVPVADKRLTVSVSRTQAGRRKVTLKYTIPTVADRVVDGITVPGVSRTAYAEITFSYDQTSTFNERHDVMNFINTTLNTDFNPWFDKVLRDLESVY